MAAIEGTSAGFQGTDGVLYSTTPGELMEKARDITATQASVQAELAALHNYVMGLAPIWGGVAALAFQRLMGDWDTHATKLQEALLGIAQGLQSTADNYVQGEHANLTNLNNISLPPARLS
ncbi:WXG100 family type VII secretion target [Streptomyces sp. NPDC012461]|jgi:WXG100 family type VII secretion target|uniref:WXG100 family type VII secretion target n=1 Tax=unclassified Streptomyces TaxID=2593676 RepID=UPI0013DA6341|nr:WXG100 family type VII secretion target [Streptomyces sp. SID9913]MBM7091501.1 WXG100 family type VII secretion target [Streptomyces sp. S12]NED16770.1 WXG100 family type VII secretion target [Streptomyces sp. SID9913]